MPKICFACKSGWYMNSATGVCTQTCPAGLVGYGTNGQGVCRRPHVCSNNRVVNTTNEVCSCDEKLSGTRSCNACSFGVDGSARCVECKNGKYLKDGVCVDKCPATTTHYGLGRNGRECRAPFECRDGMAYSLDDGSALDESCTCSSSTYLLMKWVDDKRKKEARKDLF